MQLWNKLFRKTKRVDESELPYTVPSIGVPLQMHRKMLNGDVLQKLIIAEVLSKERFAPLESWSQWEMLLRAFQLASANAFAKPYFDKRGFSIFDSLLTNCLGGEQIVEMERYRGSFNSCFGDANKISAVMVSHLAQELGVPNKLIPDTLKWCVYHFLLRTQSLVAVMFADYEVSECLDKQAEAAQIMS